MRIEKIVDSRVSPELQRLIVTEIESIIEEYRLRQRWYEDELVVCLLWGTESVESVLPRKSLTNLGEYLKSSPVFVYIDEQSTFLIINVRDITIYDKNKTTASLEGLLAHELMHIVKRREGLDSYISQEFVKNWKIVQKYVVKMRKFGGIFLSKKQILNALMINLSTLGLVIKDIYVNDEVISQGFDDELYAHYSSVVSRELKSLPFHSDTLFAKIKNGDITSLNVVYRIFLGYSIIWIPFKRAGDKRYIELKKQIDEKFSILPESIYRRFDSLTDMISRAPEALTGEYTRMLINENLRLYFSALKRSTG